MSIKNDSDEHCNLQDIVISGISGVFPQSENVEEFKDNLLAGKCMISQEDRCGSSGKTGLLKTIDRFDHSFFRITHQQAAGGLPISSRLLLEKSFEAILDAGYNPQQLKGKNVAVICGVVDSCDEEDPIWDAELKDTSLTMIHTMKANRISYLLDVHGPSFTVNTACSASMYAMDTAVRAIRNGQCDAAIVCSTNLCLSRTKYFGTDSPVLNRNGNTSPFNSDVDGYTRAEAVVVAFLQKREHARRVYANVIHTKTNCDGFKNEGITFPSITRQKELFRTFYEEVNLNPNMVSYVEMHGTATQAGDFVEGTSVEEIFCTDRTTPLKIGSVKSNMGHGEASSALCSVVKMITAFETGIIPPHIGYENPNPKIQGLHNGHLEVVTKPTPLEGKYFAVNSFGVGGANGHILLTPHDKVKKLNTPANHGIPLLVAVSGRTTEAVDYIIDDVVKKYEDTEYIRLMHEIFSEDINGHLQRGFVILDAGKEHNRSKQFVSGEKRPIWFVFSGMGSQWTTMGQSLMKIPIFAESIRKSHHILKSKGVDLMKIVTENDPLMFKNILNSFVGIAAIQIALIDVLSALDVKADGIIGHSVGELGCAYADGCLTAEQMILTAYYRGLVSLETEEIRGKMAVIGDGYNTMKNLVPQEIDIACHNSPTSCTISGPTEVVDNYIEHLKQKNVFVCEVDTSNIAYHSRYITPAAPRFNSYLKKVIPEPKLRSKKWICTSAPENEWNSDTVRYCSADYHTNNLLSPVYFEESCQFIPKNAVLIEIAPHGLLNAILKRSLPSTVTNILLTLKNHPNQVEYFLNALEQIYTSGCCSKLYHLYPPVQFPVSRSTPMISPLVKWKHDEKWPIGKLGADTLVSGSQNVFINPQSDGFKFLKDHGVNGINVYPGIAYLVIVWQTLAKMQKKKWRDLPVVFEQVRFERVTEIPDKGYLNFNVAIHIGTNNFEVTEKGAVVATGLVRVAENIAIEKVDTSRFENDTIDTDSITLDSEDFYKEMRLRGYSYKKAFRRVTCVNSTGTHGEISWDDNFVTFMDAMAQFLILQIDTRELLVPIFIRKLVIDVKRHFQMLETVNSETPKLELNFYPHINLLSSGGIQMIDWKLRSVARKQHQLSPTLETYQFIPYINNEEMDLNSAIRTCIEIVLENTSIVKIKTVELLDSAQSTSITSSVLSRIAMEILNDLPNIQADVNIVTDSTSASEVRNLPGNVELLHELPGGKSASIVLISNIQNNIQHMKKIFDTLRDDGFIITKQLTTTDDNLIENLGFVISFSSRISSHEKILLLKKEHLSRSKLNITTVEIKNDSYSWIIQLQDTLKRLKLKKDEVLVLYAEKEPTNGILGFFNSLRKEVKGINMRCFFVFDTEAKHFSLADPFYKNQFDKNLAQNVYKGGEWGSYRYLPLEPLENIQTNSAICQLETPGDFSSFRWIESPLNLNKKPGGKSLARVYYSGLNFRDIMLGSRKLSNVDSSHYSRLADPCPGFEFSGRDEEGNRVMGIVRHSGIATFVEVIPYFTWKVPHNMTLEEAASIPLVYITAICAFFVKIQLKRRATVLIHAGSGGVGQAAINICLYYNCNIFTTVGSPDKVQFMRNMYPQIPETHICYSRDTTFETTIMQLTKGRGVDVVLNSLSDEMLKASVRCVAKGGHFLEIGKSDTELGRSLYETTIHNVQLDHFFWNQDEEALKLSEEFQKILDLGVIKPIRRIIFEANEIETAFRRMAFAKHIGKVLIKLQEEDTEPTTGPNLSLINVKPYVICHSDRSYIIIGGLGGFGLELADWLVLRGARNIVLSSRSGIRNGYQMHRINLWRLYGANVIVSTEDVTKETEMMILLRKAAALGPITGVFNVAVVLEDKPFIEHNEQSFRIGVDPKATATIHLDHLTREMCPELEYFVVFSSVISGRGNAESTNYAFANSIMERICEARKSEDLPALAIQWGAIGDVGVFVQIVGDNESAVIGGTAQQKIESCLKTLDTFMKQQSPIVSSIAIAKKLQVETDVINGVANILGITDINTVSLNWTLPELGMDSILAMELRQVLESEFNFFFTPEELRKLTFAKLYQLKEDKMKSSKFGKEEEDESEKLKEPLLRIPFENGKITKELPVDENPTVFLFPGVEGIAAFMEPLAKNLNIQVLCFQYHNTIESAEFFLTKLRDEFAEIILEKLGTAQQFFIIGYSLGGLLAIEVASVLEENGKKGHIWLIDSTPAYVIRKAKAYESQKPNSSEDKSRHKAINNEQYSVLLDEENSRLSFLIKNVLSHKFSHNLLESSCTLITSAEFLFDSNDSSGLTEIFRNPVQVCHVDDTDHYTILKNSATARIIMKNSIWKEN
ncbi:fatty acid synthase-like isoform X2 [Planococcus citri]|uniref:fatty acid synthase-like isoform X2 n=1 Tax=Planococcus citri TaxID=170843 RepID=UPI0031F87B6C